MSDNSMVSLMCLAYREGGGLANANCHVRVSTVLCRESGVMGELTEEAWHEQICIFINILALVWRGETQE